MSQNLFLTVYHTDAWTSICFFERSCVYGTFTSKFVFVLVVSYCVVCLFGTVFYAISHDLAFYWCDGRVDYVSVFR